MGNGQIRPAALLRSVLLPSQLCGWTISRPWAFRSAEATWMEAQMLRRRCSNHKTPEWAAACWPHPQKTWEPLYPQRCCRQKEISGKQRGPSWSSYPLQPTVVVYAHSPTWGADQHGYGGKRWVHSWFLHQQLRAALDSLIGPKHPSPTSFKWQSSDYYKLIKTPTMDEREKKDPIN